MTVLSTKYVDKRATWSKKTPIVVPADDKLID